MKQEAPKILTELNNYFNIPDTQLAYKLGVSSMTIYRWRLGKTNPSFTELKLLKRILKGYQNVAK